MLASVIIRTYNEEKHLNELLSCIQNQDIEDISTEIVIVDSGSTDNTLNIAKKHGCRITHIKKEDFTFGRSLNVGCAFADGDFLIFVSGHCIPTGTDWLRKIIEPLSNNVADYSYGRQVGRDTTKFSEQCLFDKYFPEYSKSPQTGFFCNNANSAIKRTAWEEFKFNEELTGLEDMYLAKQLTNKGKSIAYVADAAVYHIHDESWHQVRTRYEREAFALQRIMPGVHFNLFDLFRYSFASISQDTLLAVRKQVLIKNIREILLFRIMQHWGVYRGHHEHRKLSQEMKYRYFYPKDIEKDHYEKENRCSLANESK